MEFLEAADISSLETQIRHDAIAAPTDLKDIFCKGWPTAKTVIDALLSIISNPIAKIVLRAVEVIGDAAQKAICKP